MKWTVIKMHWKLWLKTLWAENKMDAAFVILLYRIISVQLRYRLNGQYVRKDILREAAFKRLFFYYLK